MNKARLRTLQILIVIALLSIPLVLAATVSHLPSQLVPGTFQEGNYTFQNYTIALEGICIGSDCQTEWPTGGTNISQNYVHNGTEFIPKKATSAGVVQMEVNYASVDTAAGSFTVANDLTVDTDTLFVDSSGDNVGIGTTSPSGRLHVADSIRPQATFEDLGVGSNGLMMDFISPRNGDTRIEMNFKSDSSTVLGAIIYDSDPSYTGLKLTGRSGRNADLFLNSVGNVGIGETSPEGTQGLTINQGANDDNILSLKSSDVAHGVTTIAENDTYAFMLKGQVDQGGLWLTGLSETGTGTMLRGIATTEQNTRSTAARGNVILRAALKSGTGLTTHGADTNLLTIDNQGTTRYIFDSDGSGHADVEWVAFSDRRLKSNIETVPYGLSEVLALNPSIFNKESGYIENGEVRLEGNPRRMLGFIAQDVKALMPELVKDIDESNSFYSLDYGRFTPVLWKAIQEQQSQIQELKSENDVLKLENFQIKELVCLDHPEVEVCQ